MHRPAGEGGRRGKAGDGSRGKRHGDEGQQGDGPVAPEQERPEQYDGGQGDPLHIGADHRGRLGGKDAGAAQQQPCRSGPGGGEGFVKGSHRVTLSLGVQPAFAAHAGDQQGARRSVAGGEPGAVAGIDGRPGQPVARQVQEGAGRVGEAEADQQRRSGGAQPLKQGLQPRAQRCRGEILRLDVRREQVAVPEQDFLLGFRRRDGPVAHELELSGCPERCGGFA